MDIQRYLKDAYTITVRFPVLMILGGILVQILNLLSFSFLAGPLFAGYVLLTIRYLRDGRPPEYKDLFFGLKRFPELFPYFGVVLLIFAGIFMLVIPGLVFAAWWLFTLPLMADKGMRLDDAMRLSRQRVMANGLFPHIVFLLMISFIPAMLLGMLGTALPMFQFVKILLPPFQVGCLAGLYIDTFADLEQKGEMKEEHPALPIPPPEAPGGNDEKSPDKEEIFIPGE